jgi:23S rRNA (guanosine2251-2'-O)-methyltransferase
MAGRRPVHEVLMDAEASRATILEEIIELAQAARVPVHRVSANKLRAAAATEAPQGVVAAAAPLPEADLDDLARSGADGGSGGRSAPAPGAPFLLVFDGVTDPGNLGAALRSAEGAGVTGVVLPRHRAVHVTPTVTKAAAGAVEHLPLALVGGVPAAIERCKELGLWVVGLDAAGDRVVHDLGMASEGVALVLGAEGRGLSRLVRARCDVLARIPLRGMLPSLNVAAAAAIACFEVRRQRDDHGAGSSR